MSASTIIVGLGEILWDLFPDGARFGGAPANFACSAATLGGDQVEVYMASSVGHDELGNRALETLIEKSVRPDGVQRVERPTGQVKVELDGQGHASYEFASETAWDYMQWSDDLEQLAACANACCFGTLAQRSETSRETIQLFVSKTPAPALRVFDINLRPPFYSDAVIWHSLELANVLKLNEEELPVVAKICGLSGSPVELMRQVAQRFNLSCVALTRGSHGAILIGDDLVDEHEGVDTRVVDTVGAGDAFTATLTLGLLQGTDLKTINRNACKVAALVCSMPGATPSLPPDLIDG